MILIMCQNTYQASISFLSRKLKWNRKWGLKINNSELLLSVLAEKTFLKDFVIDDLCFTPEDGSEIELADLIINLNSYIIAIQLKERNKPDGSYDKNAECKWLSNKCKSAKAQMKETLRLLSLGTLPEFRNKRGRSIFLQSDAILVPIVVFKNENINFYPPLLRKHSDNGLDINCMSFEDFKEMCNILITPFEIILYLDFRKKFYERYGDVKIFINETKDGISISRPSSNENLAYFFLQEKYGKLKILQQEKYLLDFKNFINDIPDHTIANSIKNADYTILLFFALFDRNEICEFMRCLIDTQIKAKNSKTKTVHSLRSLNNDYAIIFVAGGVIDIDLLMPTVKQLANVKNIMEVSVFWENKTDLRLDFLLSDNLNVSL